MNYSIINTIVYTELSVICPFFVKDIRIVIDKIQNFLQLKDNIDKKIVLIDDGSSIDYDISEYLSDNVVLIKMNKNSERIVCRNIGAELCKSKYIIFQDVDDLYVSLHEVSNLYTYITNNDLDACYGYVMIKENNTEKIWKGPPKITHETESWCGVCSIILKKKLFDEILFVDHFPRNRNNVIYAGEDVNFMYRLFDKIKVMYNCNKVGSVYDKGTGTSHICRILSRYELMRNILMSNIYLNNKRVELGITLMLQEINNEHKTEVYNDNIYNFINLFKIKYNTIKVKEQFTNCKIETIKNKQLVQQLKSIQKQFNVLYFYNKIVDNAEDIVHYLLWYYNYFCNIHNSKIVVLLNDNIYNNDLKDELNNNPKYKNILFINNKNYIFKTNILVSLCEKKPYCNDNYSIFKYKKVLHYYINREFQYCPSFFLKSTYEVMSSEIKEQIVSNSYSVFQKMFANFNGKASKLFLTGPSLNEGIDSYNGTYGGSCNIVVNSFIKSDRLWNLVHPNIVIFSDPVFHGSYSSYTNRFFADLKKRIEQNSELIIICPMRDFYIIQNEIGACTKNIIYTTFCNSEKNELQIHNNEIFVPVTGNVFSGFAYPFIKYLNPTQIDIFGLTGKPNIEDNQYFWEHHDDTQYNEEKQNLIVQYPGFFNISYKDYNKQHEKRVIEILQKNKDIMYIHGKTYYRR